MKRPDDTLLTKSADGLTRCPTCRRHVVAGQTPRDRRCPFCAASAASTAPRLGLRGGMVAASLMGLGACGPSAAEEQARIEAEQAALSQQEADAIARMEAERAAAAAALEQARAAEEARLAEQAAAEAAEAQAAAEAAAAEAAAAAAEAEEAQASPRGRRRRADPEYTEMRPTRAPALTYGLDF